MYTIRGATTVAEDSVEAIRQATEELLTVILQKNAIEKTEIQTILCSTTADIQAAYPVKYVRLFGFTHATLFSTTEPNIKGGVARCIRLLLFVNRPTNVFNQLQTLSADLQIASFTHKTEQITTLLQQLEGILPLVQNANIATEQQKERVDVYLKGAKFLRPDLQKINIAIDGPAGSGKSSLAKLLAQTVGIQYLDTGAMYRGVTYYLQKVKIDLQDSKAIENAVQNMALQVEYIEGKQHIFLAGVDVSDKIRTPQISMDTALVAQNVAVRTKLIDMQRAIAAKYSCVVDGRDIGSNVLPNAAYKFFVTADAKIRAERRMKELEEKGEKVDFDRLLQEIILRDKQDAERKIAPLKQAEDAIFIDTTELTLQEVLQQVLQIVMQ